MALYIALGFIVGQLIVITNLLRKILEKRGK